MLRTLLESNAPRQRRRASTLASIAIHTTIIGGAIVATASAKPGVGPEAPHARDTVIYVAPRQPPRPVAAAPRTPTMAARPNAPLFPDVPVLRFGPTPIPTSGINIDVGRMIGDDRAPIGPLFGPVGPAGRDTIGERGAGPATAATVDRPAAMRGTPRPRYPEQLRAASVTGRVVVRLVVDTLGHVEPASVAIRESSHDLFERAVRAVLPSLRFTPAEVRGRKVRMLVELPFEFRLNE